MNNNQQGSRSALLGVGEQQGGYRQRGGYLIPPPSRPRGALPSKVLNMMILLVWLPYCTANGVVVVQGPQNRFLPFLMKDNDQLFPATKVKQSNSEW
jgi:hypothetical protein